MQISKKVSIYMQTKNVVPLNCPAPEFWVLEPDDLRNQVQRAFTRLCEADSKILRQRLLSGLAEAGIHIGASLFMLGIPASSLDELTPSDMGKLLRYTRINSPAVIEALAEPLSDLFVVKREPTLVN
jgi:hypothetical protein